MDTRDVLAMPSHAHHLIHGQAIIQKNELYVCSIEAFFTNGCKACTLSVLFYGSQSWLTAIQTCKVLHTPLQKKKPPSAGAPINILLLLLCLGVSVQTGDTHKEDQNFFFSKFGTWKKLT
jgi:hypothetical protein